MYENTMMRLYSQNKRSFGLKTSISLILSTLLLLVGASVTWTQPKKQPAPSKRKKAQKRIRKVRKKSKKKTKRRVRTKRKARTKRKVDTKAKKDTKSKTNTKQNTSKATSIPAAKKKLYALHKHLRTLITQGSQLLKKKKYAAFLQRFISPKDKKRILGSSSMKALAPRFGKYKAAMLLSVFEWIHDQKPTLSKNQKQATYSLKGFRSSTPKKELRFVKIQGIWYVQD